MGLGGHDRAGGQRCARVPQLRMTRTGGPGCHGCNKHLLIFTAIWAVSGAGGERWGSVGIGWGLVGKWEPNRGDRP